MTYGAFIAAESDFNNAVYTAVNLGGDTDSLGTISGVMSLFANGKIAGRPRDFEQTLHYPMLKDLSQELMKAAR